MIGSRDLWQFDAEKAIFSLLAEEVSEMMEDTCLSVNTKLIYKEF